MIMYNTTYVCKYSLDDDDSELYKTDLLNIFNFTEFKDEKINLAISNLYDSIKDCEYLNDCILKLSQQFGYEDELLNFMLLFSFDYLIYTHKCICEYLQYKCISEQNINELKKIIF